MGQIYTFIILVMIFSMEITAQIDGIYCGKENCYEILGVERDADRSTITKAYRKLAREVHPDRQKSNVDPATAEAAFRRVANAYEILRDDEQRKEYDYMLENPNAMYYHYYNYYRRVYATKVDVRIVIAVIVSLISIAQYYGQSANYREAVTELSKVQRYRTQAKEVAKERGLLEFGKKDANGRKYSKEQLKEMEEEVIVKIVQEKMDIRGGYAPPSLWDTLWLQLLCAPYYILKWCYSWLRWFWLFIILRKEYGTEEKLYLIRRNMGLGPLQFQLFSETDIQEFLKKELWIRRNYKHYAQEKADALRAKNAEDNRFKRYRRYIKKGGPGQLSFGPDADMD